MKNGFRSPFGIHVGWLIYWKRSTHAHTLRASSRLSSREERQSRPMLSLWRTWNEWQTIFILCGRGGSNSRDIGFTTRRQVRYNSECISIPSYSNVRQAGRWVSHRGFSGVRILMPVSVYPIVLLATHEEIASSVFVYALLTHRETSNYFFVSRSFK